MLRAQPIEIVASGPDEYRARCLCENKEVEYRFTMEKSSLRPGARSLHHEDAFYFVTFDDPAVEWLEQAIAAFDRAIQEGFVDGETTMFPVKILAPREHTPNDFAYTVFFREGEATHERAFEISETGAVRKVTWNASSVEASLEDGFWKLATPNPLIDAVLFLHQSINPKYSLV
jgi:hypothetical protein